MMITSSDDDEEEEDDNDDDDDDNNAMVDDDKSETDHSTPRAPHGRLLPNCKTVMMTCIPHVFVIFPRQRILRPVKSAQICDKTAQINIEEYLINLG